MNRWSEPAFGEKNRHIAHWMVKILLCYLLYFFFMYPEDVMVHQDMDRGLAIADGMLRDASFARMSEACYTDEEIKEYWYGQKFMMSPKKAYIMSRGREALCGGRWMCGCNKLIKQPKPEIPI